MTSVPVKKNDMQESPNQSHRKPQVVVLHYTAGDDAASKNWLTDPKSQVSAHYLVQADATVIQLVDEKKRAWHAGGGAWRGMADLNSVSIGIEIVGYGFEGDHVPENVDCTSCVMVPGADKSWFSFSEEQYQSIAALLGGIKERWPAISPLNFIGHSDLAPGRKVDPGPLFPWKRLYREYNIGAWPDMDIPLKHVWVPGPSDPNIIKWVQMRLRDLGYMNCPLSGERDELTLLTLQAFQMHYRPSCINGDLDEETLNALARLIDQYHYG